MQTRPQVVVVDDDDDVRDIVVRLTLETVPEAQVSSMPNGCEALAAVKANGADLVITNFHMPGMDGPALVRELRTRQFTGPVIMVSGNPEAQELGEAAGISRFVPKTEVSAALPKAILALLKAA
jgi:CheY-like chemotaxis protein